MQRLLRAICSLLCLAWASPLLAEGLKTWDGRHSIDKIAVSMVYFVPKDREPLKDWKERLDYYARRVETFHAREFGDQSTLKVEVRPEPLVSEKETAALRDGDANHIFFETLREADRRLDFGRDREKGFPILLVLSEINWKPLDDFYRVKPNGDDWVFEGNYNNGRHFPGAESGGARATYLAREGKGWGLVSADGWRVPYSGSDCVVYHEGIGHPIGLPHPDPANESVMSLAQYVGWISRSSVDAAQKARLGYKAPEQTFDRGKDLYSTFEALASPAVPKPGEAVSLAFTWPEGTEIESLRVRYQTSLGGEWKEATIPSLDAPPERLVLGTFDAPTPVSYRVDAKLKNGQTAELWGYFQVRARRNEFPKPTGALKP